MTHAICGGDTSATTHGHAPCTLPCTTMQRLLFSCSPRFTSHLACQQVAGHVEWPQISQLTLNYVPPSYPSHPGNRGLSHWVNGSHPYWGIVRSEGPQLSRFVTYGAPLYRHCQSPSVASGSVTYAAMSTTRNKSPKRQRNLSGGASRGSQSKVQKKEEKEHQQEPRRRIERVSASGRGFTQESWPQSAQECQWRRAGKEFRSAQEAASRPDQCNTRTSPPSATARVPPATGRIPPATARVLLSHPTTSGHPSCQGPGDQKSPPLTSANVTSSTQIHPTTSCVSVRQGFHPSASSDQGQVPSDGAKRTYAKRLWFDIQRPWNHQNRQSRQSNGGGRNSRPFEFSVLSYNILAQGLLESNMYLYPHCPADVLPWDYRRRNILEEIRQSDADVVCLQEVESEHYSDFFKPQLGALGYGAIYKKRTGDKGDGCATFYKTSRFRHVFHSRLEYQRRSGCLDRDNVAVIVMLQPRSLPNTHRLCVANTHLLWNPRRGDVKLAQLGLLFAEIECMSYVEPTASTPDGTYHPILLCGDFNSLPHCPLYKFVKKGHMIYEGMAAVDVSGQLEGRSRSMESPLWPRQIGVTQRCRYVHRDTNAGNANTGNSGPMGRDSSIHTNNNASEMDNTDHQQGDLHHPFLFSSVYEHNYGNREVTTNHSKTNCTVDYIFYTRGAPHRFRGGNDGVQRPSFSSDLSVTRRLSLFTDNEVRSMGGLPNASWSSDHLSLQARFSMTPIFR